MHAIVVERRHLAASGDARHPFLELIVKNVKKSSDTDILLIGHTHQEMILEVNDMLILNPGNQYIGSSTPPTFAILDVSEGWVISSILRKKGDSWQLVSGKCIFKTKELINGGKKEL